MRYVHLTNHADTRLRQRGTKPSAIWMLQQVADREIHLGDGACLVSISQKKAEQLRAAGLASGFVSRLEHISLVLAEDTGDILSVLKGAVASHYRPGGHRHRRGARNVGRDH